MEIYNSEQDQVEAIKAWWQKNGRMVIVAIVALLVGVLGWQGWQGQKQQLAESASAAYQQMMDASVAEPETAMELGRAIVGDYPKTIYSAMASLAMGRIAVEQGDLDAAAAYLRAAAEQSSQEELKLLARLRLSRVLLAQGKQDEALSQLEGDSGAFKAAFDEQRGDILQAMGDESAAYDAYTNAMAAYAEMPQKRELVELKRNDLAQGSGE